MSAFLVPVARHYGITVEELIGPSKVRTLTGPRQLAMYLTHVHGHLSKPKTGKLFGGRDHSTVFHAVRVIEARLVAEAGLRDTIDRLAAEASGKPHPAPGGEWSADELELMRKFYPTGATGVLVRMLPGRSKGAIISKAAKLGLRFTRPDPRKLPDFPTHCGGCGKALCYSRASKYLRQKPTGLCRTCCNRRPRSEQQIRKASEASRRAFEQNPEYRERQRRGVQEAMARISPEERERRRERGRRCGLSNKGNTSNPAGSPCRKLAAQRAAETRRRKIEAARLEEARRPKTFEEKLKLLAEGRARIFFVPQASNTDPEFTLGGVSSGWAA